MAWSTSELADLAGCSVKTIRHYHEVGLLELPERTRVGYKQYTTRHLVRLLTIRRLTELGASLSQICELDHPGSDPAELFRALDAEISTTIERLTGVRADLAILLRHDAPGHLPPVFAPLGSDLTEARTALLMVLARVLDDGAVADLREILAVRDPADDDFRELPPDASVNDVDDLVDGLLPMVRPLGIRYPWMRSPISRSRVRTGLARDALRLAVAAYYNPAQLQVVQRVHATVLSQERNGGPLAG